VDHSALPATENEKAKRNERVSKTKKIVNMLSDDSAAPAAARTLAKAALQEGKLISDYLMERLHPDYATPETVWDKIKRTTADQERRRPEVEEFVPSEPPPTYKEPREATAMVLAYNDQIRFLDRLKLIAKAMTGLPPGTNLARTLAAALTEGGRGLKALQKEQQPVIAAGVAARKASAEAYVAALEAWRARMKSQRAHWEKTRARETHG
jgi:hypothetical protein